MVQPYVAEIRMIGANFAPAGWALCNGQTLQISQYDVLYSLIGTTYGGNGVTTFNLPDLRGRVPIHVGQGLGLSPYTLGQVGGTETVTLNSANMPAHSHSLSATTNPASSLTINASALPATTASNTFFYTSAAGSPAPTFTTLGQGTVGVSGGGQPHPNLMPSLCVNFIMALFGLYPSRN